MRNIVLFFVVFKLCAVVPNVHGQYDSLMAKVFQPSTLTVSDVLSTSFDTSWSDLGSSWSVSFPENLVFLAEMSSHSDENPDQDFTLRIGKGGQIYSLIAGFGESIPPQWVHPNWVDESYGGGTSYAPWVDEVWQMVAVDGALNNSPDSSYFIHQAGVYLKTPDQISPFYSPVIAQYYNAQESSFTTVNWGQQAHTEDLLNTGFSSKLIYYTKYTCSYPGIIQVDQMMYNFGSDNMSFLNVPWGGVRHSNLGHTFLSNPDHSYQEITGAYGQTPVIQADQTAGWLAWSNDASGNSSALAIANTTSTVTNGNVIRYGDAGNLDAAWNQRDYSVLEMIRFPNNDQLKFGTSMSFRYFYVIGSSVDQLRDVIVDLDLESEAYDLDQTPELSDVDSMGYTVGQDVNNRYILSESNSESAWYLRSSPYKDSYPVFLIEGSDSMDMITTDPYVFSSKPWDGQASSWSLLGYSSRPLVASLTNDSVCAGDSYSLPSGEVVVPESSSFYVSYLDSEVEGTDSLVLTTVSVIPPALFFLDADQDGFGHSEWSVSACFAPPNYTSNDLDCDDSNPNVYPGAELSSDAVDGNCNGIIDSEETEVCQGDFDLDNSIATSDLLMILAWFGCQNDCLVDLNYDGATNTLDMLLFLPLYDENCE
jgi:hypothetical protein